MQYIITDFIVNVLRVNILYIAPEIFKSQFVKLEICYSYFDKTRSQQEHVLHDSSIWRFDMAVWTKLEASSQQEHIVRSIFS